MASYGSIIIQYGVDAAHPTTHKQFWSIAGGESDWLGTFGGNLDMSVATLTGPVDGALKATKNFLLALQAVAHTTVQVFSARADWRISGGPSVIEGEASITVSNFAGSGGVVGWGPYKKGFIAARQRVPSSRRPGWTRFYHIGDSAWQNSTVGDASRFSADFHDALSAYSATAGAPSNMVVWSGYPAVEGTWVFESLPEVGYCRLGDING